MISHGHTLKGKMSPTYLAWMGMRSRCENSKNAGFKYYGGKGISVYTAWHQFENFLCDMGKKPKGTRLYRVDKTKNFNPTNCKWGEPKVALKNRSTWKWSGKKRIAELAYALGICRGIIDQLIFFLPIGVSKKMGPKLQIVDEIIKENLYEGENHDLNKKKE